MIAKGKTILEECPKTAHNQRHDNWESILETNLNHKGKVILTFTKQPSSSLLVEHAETLGVLESLHLADYFNYLNIHIENDGKSAVDGTLFNDTHLNTFGHSYCHIRSLLSKLYNSRMF